MATVKMRRELLYPPCCLTHVPLYRHEHGGVDDGQTYDRCRVDICLRSRTAQPDYVRLVGLPL